MKGQFQNFYRLKSLLTFSTFRSDMFASYSSETLKNPQNLKAANVLTKKCSLFWSVANAPFHIVRAKQKPAANVGSSEEGDPSLNVPRSNPHGCHN